MTTSRRLNFPKKVRKLLAANANNLCSLYDCPRVTISPIIERSGEKGMRGLAVAAHINAASPNGPRPPYGMTPAQIKSEANGIWLCPTCARLVDDFAVFYPAEILLEMKRVRERAQELALLDPTIAYIGNSVGIKRVDKVVRDHLPSMSADKIAHDVKRLYAKWIRFEAQNEPPAQLVPLPESDLTVALAKVKSAAVPHPSLSDYHWQEIVASWEEVFLALSQNASVRTAQSGIGVARITARHPGTGEIATEFISVRPFVMHITRESPRARHDATILLRHTCTSLNPLNWELDVRPQNGEYVAYSELHCFKDLNISKASGPGIRQNFEAYSSVLAKLVDGWEPVGFIGLAVGQDADLNQVHPMPVCITNLISPNMLEKLQGTIARVQLGYQIEDTWGLKFVFTPAFFNPGLSAEVILESAAAFLKNLDLKELPPAIRSPELFKTGPYSELVFVLKQNTLAVESRELPCLERELHSLAGS